MPLTKEDLSRRYLLDVTKSGHVFVRERGTKPAPGEDGGLPVFSTATRSEAEGLRVYFCRLARDRSGLYRLNECVGDLELELEDLITIADKFRAHYSKPRRARR